MDHFIIDSPKAVKIESFFVPFSGRNHLLIRLISNNMVNFQKIDFRYNIIEFFFFWMLNESWQEKAFIVVSLNESVNRVSISVNGGQNDSPVFILERFRWENRFCPSQNCFLEINPKNLPRKERKRLRLRKQRL
jgi:hypothetical protein